MVNQIWNGQWVRENLGITVDCDPEKEDGFQYFVGLALRHNPKRAHLLVSRFLGKHVPADPRGVYTLGLGLGENVRGILKGEQPLVLGYAETATGLGHAVADELDADYLHSTRRAVPGVVPVSGFQEEHSHASSHLLLPTDPMLLASARPLVLVDDELTTGLTVVNTIRALHASNPRALYVVASVLDARVGDRDALITATAHELHTSIFVTSILLAPTHLPDDVIARAEQAMAAYPSAHPSARPVLGEPRAEVVQMPDSWPVGVRDGGRHGFGHEDRRRATIAARGVAARLADRVRGDRVLVLGSEELMYAPTIIAVSLAAWARDGQSVEFSSTTRSPVFPLDDPGYAIRTALTFPAHDDAADGTRYAYNVAPASDVEPFTDIVLVIDDVGDTPALRAAGGLLDQLSRVCERVFLVVLPSYRPGTA